jgi:ADP-heptose:LPS heptosyltransferase
LQLNPNPEAQQLFGDRWHETGHTLQNFMDTVNWIQKMDMVITVDTALVHIAGSIEKECYLLLPFTNDWRWKNGSNEKFWYSNVSTIKQSSPAIWVDNFKECVHKISKKNE